MAIDTETPRSPGWWLSKLELKLRARREGEPLPFGSSTTALGASLSLGRSASWAGRAQSEGVWSNRPGIDLLADYLRGEPPLPVISKSWAEAVRPYVRLSRTNFAELVVSAVLDRMVPLGWATAVEDDRDGDQLAARIAAVNNLAAVFPEALEHMLALGDGYMAVGKHPSRTEPLITAQDPRGCIVAEDSATGDPLASLILRVDEWTGDTLAHVHVYDPATPDGTGTHTHVYRRGGTSGEWSEDAGQTGPTPGFTVVRFRNRAGVGDYERHLDVLDRINDQVFRRIAIALYQAFRQRGAKNLPRHDEQGQEIDYSTIFSADPGAMWDLPEGVDIWESGVVDLTGILQAIKADAIMLAAVTATSLHYITPDAASGSAEGASTMRERMIYRTEDRRRRTEGPTARMWSAAFRLMGDTARADAMAIRTLWQPAERYSLSERAQANAQAKAGDVPWAARMTDVMGYGPADLPRLEQMRGADQLFEPLQAPAATSQQPQAPARGANGGGAAPEQPGGGQQSQNATPQPVA